MRGERPRVIASANAARIALGTLQLRNGLSPVKKKNEEQDFDPCKNKG
jgi:hypothetical protein